MSDEISPDIAALYRAGATEEPDARLDSAVLRLARRRPLPRLAFAALSVLLLALSIVALRPDNHVPPPPAVASTEAALPPGMADGRGRLLASSAVPERPGMNAWPVSAHN